MADHAAPRARSKTPPPRPTTPLRPPSRTSLHRSSSHHAAHAASTPTSGHAASTTTNNSGHYDAARAAGPSPLDALEPAFGELADGMADLEANLMHVQLMHESIARFSENFAAFLHGLKLNAFCVDFPEAPGVDSFRRARARAAVDAAQLGGRVDAGDMDQTFLTTDTSFVENPPTSSSRSSRFATPAPARGASSRAGRASGVPRGAPSTRTRPSGLARASGRGRASFR